MQINDNGDAEFIYDDYLFLFGHWSTKIIGINLVNKKVDFVYNIPNKFISMKEEKADAFFSNYILKNNKVYLPFLSGGYFVVFDLKNREIEWKEVGAEDQGFSQIYYEKKEKLLLCRRNERGLVLFDETSNYLRSLFEKYNFNYSIGIYSIGSMIWIPCYNSFSYLIDIHAERCEIEDIKYILRGYENLDEKLNRLGANIKVLLSI